jgi:hypothetical protein
MACEYEPYGFIGERWRAEGGEQSVFGCPGLPKRADCV